MTRTKLVLMGMALCGCIFLPQVATAQNSTDENAQSVLEDLRQENKLLKARIAELEARLERMEAARDAEPAKPNVLREIGLRRLNQVLELEPPRSKLPLGGDKGLYVFPGIDAPPLSPTDALRGRLGK